MAGEMDEKFAHFLQPLRDLASNWNVDIASELAEYMEVLEGITFSFEGGASLNFAEAALLIQGSACVYSKKVEYLHSLVYQALEFIAERKRKDFRPGAVPGEAAAEVDEFDDEEQFLALDDCLEEGGAGIDLDDDAAPHVAAPARPPAALLALEDGCGDGEAGNYRIAACAVHRSGALLLESRDGDDLDEYLQPMAQGAGAAGAMSLPGTADALDAIYDDGDSDGGHFGDEDYGSMGGEGAAEEGALAGSQPGSPQLPAEPADNFFDPYKPLDPGARGSLAYKPFKRASRMALKPKARPPPHTLAAAAVLGDLLTLQAPAAGTLLPEFAHALVALRQSDQDGKPARAAAGGRAAPTQRAQQASAFTLEDAAAAGGEADDADDGAADFYGGGFDDDGVDYGPAGDFGDVPELEGAAEAWMQAHTGAAGGVDAAAAAAAEAERSAGEMTYEELCRVHIEAFITAAAASEVQTELASRVSMWRAKMAPALEEENARPEFDIHHYGQHLLQRMAALSCGHDAAVSKDRGAKGKRTAEPEGEPQLTFEAVMEGSGAAFDISRSFSSMLQLVNNGNVRLTKLGGSNENFRLELLDATLPHRQIQDFRAPSAVGGETEAGEEAAGGPREKVLGEKGNASPAKAVGSVKAAVSPAPAAKASKRRRA